MMVLKKNPRYDLKLKYRRTLEIGMVCSLCMLLFAFKYFPDYQSQKIADDEVQNLITTIDIPTTNQLIVPPPPPRPVVPVETPIDIEDDTPIDIPEFDVKSPVLPPPPKPKIINAPEPVPDFYMWVEQLPSIVGGIEALNKKVIYPEIAIRANVQGIVYIEAFVNEFGDVVNAVVQRGIGAGCDEAAVTAIKDTKFNPGMQRGKAVRVRISVPVKFVLSN